MLGCKRTLTSSPRDAKRRCLEPTVVFPDLAVDTSKVLPGTKKVVIREACWINPKHLGEIADCKTITYFTMKHWPQEHEGLDQLSKLNDLQHLNLKGSFNLRDAGLSFLPHLPSLLGLKLSGCSSLDGSGLACALSNGITSLDLSGCLKFLGQHLIHVAAISTLRKLNLTNCHNVTDEFLHLLLPLLNLEKLIFGWCRDITDKGLKVLADLGNLRMLTLNGCHVTGEGLVHFRKDGPLVELEMQSCPLTSASFEQMPPVEALDVTRCTALVDDHIATIAHRAPKLKVLSFSYCPLVTEAMYPALLSLPHLIHLKISSFSVNHDVAFDNLCKMHNLTYLVTGLYTFTPERMQELRDALPLATIVASC